MKRFLSCFLILFCLMLSFPSAARAASRTYTDEVTGISFTLPEKWSVADEDRTVMPLTTFQRADAESAPVSFLRIDLYPELSGEEMKKYSREDIDNDYYIAESLNAAKELLGDYEIVTYGDKEYFCVFRQAEEGRDPISATPYTALLRVKQGCLFLFAYPGEKTDPGFKEFEKLLLSVDDSHIDPLRYSLGIANLSIGMKRDQVHSALGKPEQVVEDKEHGKSDLFIVDYAARPRAFDPGGVWESDIAFCVVQVGYEDDAVEHVKNIAFQALGRNLEESGVCSEYAAFCDTELTVLTQSEQNGELAYAWQYLPQYYVMNSYIYAMMTKADVTGTRLTLAVSSIPSG